MYVVTLHGVLGYPTNFASAFFLQKGKKYLSSPIGFDLV